MTHPPRDPPTRPVERRRARWGSLGGFPLPRRCAPIDGRHYHDPRAVASSDARARRSLGAMATLVTITLDDRELDLAVRFTPLARSISNLDQTEWLRILRALESNLDAYRAQLADVRARLETRIAP